MVDATRYCQLHFFFSQEKHLSQPFDRHHKTIALSPKSRVIHISEMQYKNLCCNFDIQLLQAQRTIKDNASRWILLSRVSALSVGRQECHLTCQSCHCWSQQILVWNRWIKTTKDKPGSLVKLYATRHVKAELKLNCVEMRWWGNTGLRLVKVAEVAD